MMPGEQEIIVVSALSLWIYSEVNVKMIITDNMDALKANPYLNHMNDKDMKWFLKCTDAEIYEVKAGEAILRAGEKLQFVPILLTGSSDVEIPKISSWERHGSESGLSQTVKSLIAPLDCKAVTDCLLLRLKVMRLLHACNYRCQFHLDVIDRL